MQQIKSMAAISRPRQGLGAGAGRAGVKPRATGCSADPCLGLQCPIPCSFVNESNTSRGKHSRAAGESILLHSEPLGTSRTKPPVTVNKIVPKAKQRGNKAKGS